MSGGARADEGRRPDPPAGGCPGATGAAPAAGTGQPPPAPGQTLTEMVAIQAPGARLRPLAALARGGTADVLLAEQVDLGRQVAVKIAKRHDPDLRAAFAAEALVAAWLEHPGVVPVHEAGDDFLVMRRVAGETLAELIARDGIGPAALERHGEILVQVAQTARFAHSRGLIHRDIKPSNIMVGSFGEVALLDWGLAVQVQPAPDGRQRAPDAAAAEPCAGTPAYMAPEVADADRAALSPATDVFLLGATLWHVLAGRPPYRADSVRRSLEAAWRMRCGDLRALNPAAPPALVALAERAMRRDPAERGDAAMFIADLRAWLARSGAQRLAAAERERAAALLRDPHAGVAALAEAAAACDRALGADPDDAASAALRATALARQARLAMAAGDLIGAAAAAAASGDAALQAELAGERERRLRRDGIRGSLRSAAAIALAVACAVSGGVATAAWSVRGSARAGDAADARSLAAAVAADLGAPSGPGCARALAAAERAAAVDPIAGAASLRLALAAAGRWAALNGRIDQARALHRRLAALPDAGPAAAELTATLAAAEARRGERLAARLRERSDAVERLRRRAGPLGAEAVRARAADLAGWPAPADDAHRALIRRLAAADEPSVRRCVALGAGQRPDLLPDADLAALAADADRQVAGAAAAAMAARARRDPSR